MSRLPSMIHRLLLLFLLISAGTGTLAGQNPKDFALANQLIQYGNYKDAAEILQRLYRENPRSYPVFNKLVRCLTELKSYKEAIRITRNQLQGRYSDVSMAVSLGDLYFLSGDTTAALKQWKATIDANRASQPAWREVLEAMANRRFYAEAEAGYQDARKVFNAPSLFMNELSSLYLQWGKYTKAAREWVALVEQDPSKAVMLQRRLFRFEDEEYLDAFIVELEEASRTLNPQAPNYYAFRDLLIWMYTEKKMYRKALAAARQLEAASAANGLTPVLTLGARLAASKQFALADEAFGFYDTANLPHILKLSLEERARLYKTWGDEIRRSDAGTAAEAHDKYRRSLAFLEKWVELNGESALPPDLGALYINLVLDRFKDTGKAEKLLASVRRQPAQGAREPEWMFLEGRLEQMKGRFPMARLHFNRALKADPLSETGERSRYYLGLTDFYAGDFEFSMIQLRALERQSSSLYANDALRLRTWMQEGGEEDTLKPDLRMLARGLYLMERGEERNGLDTLHLLMKSFPASASAAFAAQAAADFLSTLDVRLAAAFLNSRMPALQQAPNLERLLWMQARFSDLASSGTAPAALTDRPDALNTVLVSGLPVFEPVPVAALAALYEKLLERYPAGFFARQVRDRLQVLERGGAS